MHLTSPAEGPLGLTRDCTLPLKKGPRPELENYTFLTLKIEI